MTYDFKLRREFQTQKSFKALKKGDRETVNQVEFKKATISQFPMLR
jgi:hypothetical protein